MMTNALLMILNAQTPLKSPLLANGNSHGKPFEPPPIAPSTPEREHAAMTRVRAFEDVRFGEYLIKTWYVSSSA